MLSREISRPATLIARIGERVTMTIIITARDGKTLRDYAASRSGNPRTAIFPEMGLSPDEQAAFLEEHGGEYDEVITFSAFIVSDASPGSLQVLGEDPADVPLKQGDSVNKITMKLWRSDTIGNRGQAILDDARNRLGLADDRRSVEKIIHSVYESLGDSVERVLFIRTAMSKADSLAD